MQRQLEEQNIKKWHAVDRPLLEAKHKQQRLEWARRYRHYTAEDWEVVFWSDEMSVCKMDTKPNTWVFRTPKEKWDQDCIETKATGSRTSVMFWGFIAGRLRGPLTTLVPDEGRMGKKGVTAEIILDAYKECLADIMEEDLGQVFMQNNARVHTTKLIMDWLDEKGYSVMSWPPYSPDLNPIEMVWYRIKTYIHKHHPELQRMTEGEEATQDAIIEAVIEAWEALDEGFLLVFYQEHASAGPGSFERARRLHKILSR